MKKFIKFFVFTAFTFTLFLFVLNVKYVDAADVFPFRGTIVADALGVHSTDDYNSSSEVTQLLYGSKVTVLGLGSNGSRYLIQYDGDKKGYVAKSYVENIDTSTLITDAPNIETYRSYCDSLKAQGFIESYCPYLYYLHSKHPAWIFKAEVINNTLDYVAGKELWKNVLETSNSNYWESNKPIEGSYYYVKQNVIESFLDPRNSLFEAEIFQFLDFEATKDFSNDVALSKVARSNGNLKNYYNEFKTAASQNGVNALHLMVRSQQEGADTPTYSAITGTYSSTWNRNAHNGLTLNGYYNFFNIGSWETDQYTTVGRGLAHAAGYLEKDVSCFTTNQDGTVTYNQDKCGVLSYGRPWNTPAKAIAGGAQFISLAYVKNGQNTGYYEKFNVSPNAKNDLYTHQYQTGIAAPSSESRTMSFAYQAGGLFESAFTFVIPVYQNMPDLEYQPVDKDTNSKLSSIVVDGTQITGFDSDVVEYTYNCVTDKDYVEVSALAMSGKSTISGVGKINFTNGVASTTIVVTAEDGSKTNYKVTVKKITPEKIVKVSDIVSKMGVKISGEFMYQISPGTAITTLIETVTSNGGTARVLDSNGTKKENGTLATGDMLVVSGTKESVTYKIGIRGDVNGDGVISVLDLLRCQKHILNSLKLEGTQSYAADTNYDGTINVLDLLKIQKHVLGTENL